jgi:hypothetical protein
MALMIHGARGLELTSLWGFQQLVCSLIRSLRLTKLLLCISKFWTHRTHHYQADICSCNDVFAGNLACREAQRTRKNKRLANLCMHGLSAYNWLQMRVKGTCNMHDDPPSHVFLCTGDGNDSIRYSSGCV